MGTISRARSHSRTLASTLMCQPLMFVLSGLFVLPALLLPAPWLSATRLTPRLLKLQTYALPKSIITRLAKGVLPANTQIQANAILAITKSTTLFISHLVDE